MKEQVAFLNNCTMIYNQWLRNYLISWYYFYYTYNWCCYYIYCCSYFIITESVISCNVARAVENHWITWSATEMQHITILFLIRVLLMVFFTMFQWQWILDFSALSRHKFESGKMEIAVITGSCWLMYINSLTAEWWMSPTSSKGKW